MRNKFPFTPTTLSKIDALDFNNIPFGRVFTDHMFVADFKDGEWSEGAIVPLAPIPVHPGNLAWHYGQAIFEGMKATKDKDGQAMLFRPEMHIKRLNASAERMCMPTFSEEQFLDAVHQLVDIESDWIPPAKGSALYLRPLMIAMDEAIGVRASDSYKLIIMTLPVGPYYAKPVSLKTETTFVRAADGGVGEAKTAGNYAASLRPALKAKEAGYDQIMWLDAKEFKYVQEVGTMNIFFVIDGVAITPATDGSILKGITRNGAIQILKSKGVKVEERKITIDEVVAAFQNGTLSEAFGTGTAAVVSFVEKIAHKDQVLDLSNSKNEIANMIKATINGMRYGDVADEFGWVVPVDTDRVKA